MHELFTDPAFWLLFLFLVPLLLKFPIAMAMGTSAAFVIWFWDMGWQSISYSFFANIAKVPLLAIPFFIRSPLQDPQIRPDLDRLLQNAVGGATVEDLGSQLIKSLGVILNKP